MKPRVVPVDEALIQTGVHPVQTDALGVPYEDWRGPRLKQEAVPRTGVSSYEPASSNLTANDMIVPEDDLPNHRVSENALPTDPETLDAKVRANDLSEGILGRNRDLTRHVTRLAVRAAGGPVTQVFSSREVAEARGVHHHAQADERDLSWSRISAVATGTRPNGQYVGRRRRRAV